MRRASLPDLKQSFNTRVGRITKVRGFECLLPIEKSSGLVRRDWTLWAPEAQ